MADWEIFLLMHRYSPETRDESERSALAKKCRFLDFITELGLKNSGVDFKLIKLVPIVERFKKAMIIEMPHLALDFKRAFKKLFSEDVESISENDFMKFCEKYRISKYVDEHDIY